MIQFFFKSSQYYWRKSNLNEIWPTHIPNNDLKILGTSLQINLFKQ